MVIFNSKLLVITRPGNVPTTNLCRKVVKCFGLKIGYPGYPEIQWSKSFRDTQRGVIKHGWETHDE